MSSGDSQDPGYGYKRYQENGDEAELRRTLAELNDPSSPNSPLYKALLNQSMTMNHANQNPWSPLVQGLTTYMQMQGNPNMQGSWAYNKALGQNIGAGIEQPQIGMPGLNVTDLMSG